MDLQASRVQPLVLTTHEMHSAVMTSHEAVQLLDDSPQAVHFLT
jgi:hypothetical protein